MKPLCSPHCEFLWIESFCFRKGAWGKGGSVTERTAFSSRNDSTIAAPFQAVYSMLLFWFWKSKRKKSLNYYWTMVQNIENISLEWGRIFYTVSERSFLIIIVASFQFLLIDPTIMKDPVVFFLMNISEMGIKVLYIIKKSDSLIFISLPGSASERKISSQP